MEPLLLIPIILSFFLAFLAMPYWIKRTKRIGLVWQDMNKHEKKEAAGSGGVVVMLAFILGVLSYIAIKVFVLHTNLTTLNIFALLTTTMIAASVGFVDDVFGWMHGGLPAKLRIFLVLIAAIPLMVINVGDSIVNIPFIGAINFGIIYPLIFI